MVMGLAAAAALLVILAVELFGAAGYRELSGFERLACSSYVFLGFLLFSISLVRLLRPETAHPYSPIVPMALVGIGYPLLAWILLPLLPAPLVVEEGGA